MATAAAALIARKREHDAVRRAVTLASHALGATAPDAGVGAVGLPGSATVRPAGGRAPAGVPVAAGAVDRVTACRAPVPFGTGPAGPGAAGIAAVAGALRLTATGTGRPERPGPPADAVPAGPVPAGPAPVSAVPEET
ncbi:hypothetical protein V1L54_06095 [Streptomyces sp. TRM 70361]|uniref:hypothetical protein n=1 Tax=Streptomyces sp. TRM 70361 TaxID=3116553 RepID=UPI002E7C24A0|nr:hypothetical protein [Streptomyces sp. TRM 70361]MEE1938989.1 hypothetical protein [Streptomyces sp. TRM 70361]